MVPTYESVADYLTKHLCGYKFKHFRKKTKNLKATKLVTLSPLTKNGKYSDHQKKVGNNMIQLSKSLVERNIITNPDVHKSMGRVLK